MSCEVKTYLDEKKADMLKEAAVLADDYVLTHKGTFSQRTTVSQLDQRAPPFFPNNHRQKQNNAKGNGKNHHPNAQGMWQRYTPFPPRPQCYYVL